MGVVNGVVEGVGKPAICEAGHILVITAEFYRVATGSAVVMRNLLAQFAPESFTVLTREVAPQLSADVPPDIRVLTVRIDPPFTTRGERYWRDLAHPYIKRRIKRIVQRVRPALILAVYPTLHIFSAAIEAAEANGIPWVAYMHDTLAEQYRDTKHERWAEDVQHKVFTSAGAILVTGRGMVDLYRAKHSVECRPLEIGYCEPIPTTLAPPPAGVPYVFMGGTIYGVNKEAVVRTMQGAEQAGARFRLAIPASWAFLKKLGIQQQNAERVYYASRKEYLEALFKQHILAVALNWPDECSIPQDELATAFPTRAVEYLASGQPILVHCPENYFLARFFHEHECGIVVSTRDIAALTAAIRTLVNGGPEVERLRCNALRAARIFAIDRIRTRLKQELENAVRRFPAPVRR
jgi:glycosyltransferase involved in cell wall biosynthesis